MKKYKVNFVTTKELYNNLILLDELLSLVVNVYNKDDMYSFYNEIHQNTKDIVICYLTDINNDKIIALGCITESYISDGTYELFWGMVKEEYRGNGYGKILIDERINYISNLFSINSIIVVTKSPWHLARCGFKTIKTFQNGEELMCLEIIKNNI